MDPENVDAVIDKAETHISNEEFDEGKNNNNNCTIVYSASDLFV